MPPKKGKKKMRSASSASRGSATSGVNTSSPRSAREAGDKFEKELCELFVAFGGVGDALASSRLCDVVSFLEASWREHKGFECYLGNCRNCVGCCSWKTVPDKFADFRLLNIDKAHSVMKIFEDWDTNGDGVIGIEELTEALVTLGAEADRVEMLFAAADLNEDGKVDYTEFVSWIFSHAPLAVRELVDGHEATAGLVMTFSHFKRWFSGMLSTMTANETYKRSLLGFLSKSFTELCALRQAVAAALAEGDEERVVTTALALQQTLGIGKSEAAAILAATIERLLQRLQVAIEAADPTDWLAISSLASRAGADASKLKMAEETLRARRAEVGTELELVLAGGEVLRLQFFPKDCVAEVKSRILDYKGRPDFVGVKLLSAEEVITNDMLVEQVGSSVLTAVFTLDSSILIDKIDERLNKLNKGDIHEIRAFGSPPLPVLTTFEILRCMLAGPPADLYDLTIDNEARQQIIDAGTYSEERSSTKNRDMQRAYCYDHKLLHALKEFPLLMDRGEVPAENFAAARIVISTIDQARAEMSNRFAGAIFAWAELVLSYQTVLERHCPDM